MDVSKFAKMADDIAEKVIKENAEKAMKEVGEKAVKEIASESTEQIGKAAGNMVDDAAKVIKKSADVVPERLFSELDLESTVDGVRYQEKLKDMAKQQEKMILSESGDIQQALEGMESIPYEKRIEQFANDKAIDEAYKMNGEFDRIQKIKSSRNSASSSYAEEKAASITEEVMNQKPRSLEDYAQQRYLRKQQGIEGEYADTVSALNGDTNVDRLYKKFGVDKGDPQGLRSKIDEHYESALGNLSAEPTATDWVGYNRVPQKAAAVGGTAWLISKMSTSGGRQSNAELYGQQSPYN